MRNTIWKINEAHLEYINDSKTVGKLKNSLERKFTRNYKKVGAIDVELLKEFLSRLNEEDIIGVYVDKKNELVPLHCRGNLIAPILAIDRDSRKTQEESEFTDD